jgi:hypothetical protein
MKPELVRAKKIGQMVGVTPATVLAWARRAWIPCLRAGRRGPVLFDPEAVRTALSQRGRDLVGYGAEIAK